MGLTFPPPRATLWCVDDRAFRTLALAELEAVHRLAHHLAPRPQDAEDWVQETYLRALNSAGGFQLGPRGIRPWLFKILHNVMNTRLARQGKAPAAADDLDGRADGAPDGQAGWVDLGSIDWEQIDGRLVRGIGALPSAQREAFLLFAVEDLAYREIADVTGVPIGTVMSRLHRARQALSRELAALAPERRADLTGMEKSS